MSDTVDAKTAEAEFGRLAEGWDLDTDVGSMDEDDHQGFDSAKRCLVRAISKGFLSVDSDDETARLTLKTPVHELTELAFTMPDGGAYIAMDRHKDRKTMHKVYSFMSAMTGKPERLFSAMKGVDCKRAQALAMLFLGS